MAHPESSYNGVVRNGKVELEPGASLLEGAQVVVTLTYDSGKPKQSTPLDLLNSEIFGMWSDRDDIKDSAEYARRLRQRVWKRKS